MLIEINMNWLISALLEGVNQISPQDSFLPVIFSFFPFMGILELYINIGYLLSKYWPHNSRIFQSIFYQRFLTSHCCSFWKLVAIVKLFKGDEFFKFDLGKKDFKRVFRFYTLSDKKC